jgi:outer membrane immunogenic protein
MKGKNMRPLLIAPALIALLAAPTPLLAQSASWTGPYVGGRLGYTAQAPHKDETILFDTGLDGTFGDTVSTTSGANAFNPGFCGGAAAGSTVKGCSDRDGVEWAAHAGFDYQLGSSIVVGLVAEYGRSTIEDSVTAFSSTPAFYTMTRRLRDNGSIRARAGFTIGDNLVYGTGGIAYGKVQRSFRSSNVVNTFTESDDGQKTWGYRVGGGLERRITPNFSIGAQYLYTSLKDDDYVVRSGGANVPVSNPFILKNPQGTDFRRSSNRFNSHNVSVVASFRF